MDFINLGFNLQIFDYMISHYQGKFAFISVLSALNSTHFKSGEQIFVKNDLIKTEKMRSELITQQKLFFDKGKCSNDNLEYRALRSQLEQISMDLLNHAEKVEPIINSTDYSSDPEKVNYLVASYGRISYQKLHQCIYNLDSAVTLNLVQDAANIQNMRDAALKNRVDFDNFVQNAMLSKEPLTKETYIVFWENCVTIGALLRAACHEIDMYKTLCEKENFDYSDYPYILPSEIEDWKNLSISPTGIGYWKACDFTPSSAATWISANITDPFFAITCIKYNISVNDASLSIQSNVPLVLARRWISLGVPFQEGLERMKKGEMPALISPGERML